MRFCVIILLVIWGVQSQAGAWPRTKGEGFLSFSSEYDDNNETAFTALYIEYGITPRITAGIDLGFADTEIFKAVVFGRYPLSKPEDDWQIALELGVGVSEDEPIIRPGLMLGRGWDMGKVSGWLSIDALAYYASEQDNVNLNTDITLGVNWQDNLKLLMQLQNRNHPMDPDYLNLVTSVVVEKKPGLHVEIGVKTGLKNTRDMAVKLGLWHKF